MCDKGGEGRRVYYLNVSHVLKLLNTGLGVTLTDLSKGLVFVPALLHILCMQEIHLSGFGVITSRGQL